MPASLDQCFVIRLSTIGHMRSLSKVLFIGLLAFTAVSCGADATTQTTDAVNQSQSASASASASATDFDATLVGGGEINLQSELQKSPVALWFWAPG
jgi:hypothetical protein